MTARAPGALTDDERRLFAGLADLLIPRYGKMPAASEVGVHGDMLDAVLRARPDIGEAFRRGIGKARGKAPSEAANDLARDDAEAFAAVSLAASAGYYMTDVVRQLLGYPGQERASYDPYETPAYLTNGMIERVVRRGPVYRSTPQPASGHGAQGSGRRR